MAMKALSKTKAATIYQVAQRAGVSIATVSRALRDSELVTEETRARVHAAAAELNFTPNRLGRSLAEGRHAANGIVFPDLVGPYYAEVVLGYEAAAAGFGSSVLILATHGRADAAAAVQELAGRVDGLAIMGQTVGDDVVERIAATGLPLVLLARDPVKDVDTIRTRNERTAQALAAHLLGHGHRTFAFLGDPGGAPDVAGRYAGIAARLRAQLVPCDLDLESGQAAARELLRDPPDAIVCANDEVALGVHLAAEAAGLRVPDDVAVTGWDDLLAARFAHLTTVSQPMRELGATAARWLDHRITERTTDPAGRATAARRRVLPTELVVRRSCGHHPPEVRT
ncbi:LacI family DNA-binding transcriptional regulator [Actinoplanes friuliensis]|jgi:LacI family transcriptional regulator|uniref:LacI family transcriptional regulator n=1 Tax=Actinoplanes friuliensis DSM 7358 TaxID=1246995 RepID=U5W073_9ACTN|nr:LacI family DNA-binding transcriptional regulator [Actinoplanes friuliensis]AGZ42603.1 LacI family transcriptional regulator [Actinoplanes friuliensis DSM 7358]